MTQTGHPAHVTHYRIRKGADPEELHTNVEKAIHEGWQPFGSLVLNPGDAGERFLQPMVRYAEWYR